MLTRWASAGNLVDPARRISALSTPLITEQLLKLPSLEAIADCQTKQPPSDQSGFALSKVDGLKVWKNETGQLYIPQDDLDMQLRICVAAHCGLGGHRGRTTTKAVVS